MECNQEILTSFQRHFSLLALFTLFHFFHFAKVFYKSRVPNVINWKNGKRENTVLAAGDINTIMIYF